MDRMQMTSHKCYDCGKTMKEGSSYKFQVEDLGSFEIKCHPGEYHFCECGCELVHITLARRIEQAEFARRKVKILELLSEMDVPYKRLSDYEWLLRNLPLRNSGKTGFDPLMRLLKIEIKYMRNHKS